MGIAAGLGGFAQGFANGYRLIADEQNREQEQALQNKRLAMEEQRQGWAKNEADYQQEQRDNQRAINKAVADAMAAGSVDNNAGAVTYTNDAGEQKTAYQPDLKTAQFAAQQDANERGLPSTYPDQAAPTQTDQSDSGQQDQSQTQGQYQTATNVPSIAQPQANSPVAIPASSVSTLDGGRKLFTGLDSAAQAKQYADENAPSTYAKYMALSEKLAGMAGGQAIADQYLQRAKALDKEGAFKAYALADAGQYDAAKKFYNSTGLGRLGADENIVKSADGKSLQVVKSDGTVVVPDVKQALLNHIGGAETIVSQAQAQNKLANDMALKRWEYENDPTKRYVQTKPGGQILDTKTNTFVADNNNGYVPALDASGNPIYDEDGEMRMVRGPGGAGKGAGTAKSNDVPGAIKESLKGNEGSIGTATELAAAFKANNPGMPDASANALGLRAASGANRTAVYNPDTGMFDEYFKDAPQVDKDGKTIGFGTGKSFLVQSHAYTKGGPIQDKDAASAVSDLQKKLPPAQFQSYVAASSPDAYNEYKAKSDAYFKSIVDKATSYIAATNADTTLNPQQKAEKLQAIQNSVASKQNEIKADLRRLDLVRQFYKPTPDKSSANPPDRPPSANLSISDRLKQPGGLGSAVPRAAAEKAAADEDAAKAAAQQRDAANKAAADARVAADKQARQEITGLTPTVIRNITDLDTAVNLYNKYNLQLNGFQREAFQQLIPKLRRMQLQDSLPPNLPRL